MPIQVSEHRLTPESLDYMARVLGDTPAERERLEAALNDEQALAFEAIFNGRPVALMLLRGENGLWHPQSLVVHPATRGRGVGSSLAREVAKRLGDRVRIPPECAPLIAPQ